MQTKRRASKTTLRKKNILTVPREIADRMHLAEGDEFIVTEEQGRIVLTPALSIPADQAWFWTPQWLESTRFSTHLWLMLPLLCASARHDVSRSVSDSRSRNASAARCTP